MPLNLLEQMRCEDDGNILLLESMCTTEGESKLNTFSSSRAARER